MSSLRRVVLREIRTLYVVSEMLECGHRFDSETLLADPLVAKHRSCAKCAALIALPPNKKPPMTALLETRGDVRRSA